MPAITLMPSWRVWLAALMNWMLVVDSVEATTLPRRSSSDWTSLSLRASNRLPATKVVTENATLRARSAVLVVMPHSRSMVPLASIGSRVADDTATR